MSPRLFRARPARVVPAVIVAILILAIGAGLAWAAIAAISVGGSGDSALSSGFSVFNDLGAAQWGAAAIIAVGVVLVVLGLIFTIAGISPGAKRFAGYRAEAPEHIARFEVVLPTTALSNLAAAAADSVDGVSSVRASSNASSTNVTFSTPVRDNDQIRTDVDAAVAQRFSQIAFDRTPTVKVRTLRRQA
ncbi:MULTISPECIES: DUF6286 domain-containing protein [Brevibacterium]|uniref:DUF6286 domain-containing protein n=3 Tax=Brevibacterium TaxID=1696 RepID=A0A2H1KLS2_9MICO|nr:MULTISPECIES: DUF6286 domain-containing protein [Brevibacterium]SMX94896.1 hypothetical protein BANT10_02700 [Brevibacterium antiquum]SMY00727.1 hypothetical protein BANT918_02567 [Brevibacterium antiquum CNRZ 918]HCG57422.1 hypothetical protein [Brevibacterium sp.]